MSHPKRMLLVAVALAALSIGLPCQGAWIYWEGDIDNDFMNSGNWSANIVPGNYSDSDVATFQNGGTAVLSDVHTVYRVYTKGAGGTVVIEQGGSLTVTQQTELAYTAGSFGNVVVDGGTFTNNWMRLGVYENTLGTLTVNNPTSVYNETTLSIGDYRGNGDVTFGKGDINIDNLVLASGGSSTGKLTVIGGDNDIVAQSFEKRYGVGTLRFELNPFTAMDQALLKVVGNARFRDNSFIEIDLGEAPHGTYTLMEAGNWIGTSYLDLASPSSDSGYSLYLENGQLKANVTRVVPEPTTTVGLAVLGLTALVRRRRRRA